MIVKNVTHGGMKNGRKRNMTNREWLSTLDNKELANVIINIEFINEFTFDSLNETDETLRLNKWLNKDINKFNTINYFNNNNITKVENRK